MQNIKQKYLRKKQRSWKGNYLRYKNTKKVRRFYSYSVAQEAKEDSDEDLDIEDEDKTPMTKKSGLPDIRIGGKTKKGAKNKASMMLKETLRGVKEKDEEIVKLKDEIRKSQMKVKLKDKEIFKLRARIKKYSSSTHTAYNY